ncbi:hypothetical protein GGX14DRAFT_394791 [Mycena pura]|uniref:Uncharacterized protein n=1 Tax=Mycena pura TaxID=153505 RepID=A0AAD6YBH7_9AGAR|nr:hypothetical protein GGX14DRAFT_394791 [Mycena pura]
MPPSFRVIDDNVVPHGGSYDTITPREHTRLFSAPSSFGVSRAKAGRIEGCHVLRYCGSGNDLPFDPITFIHYESTAWNDEPSSGIMVDRQVEVLMNGLLLKFTVRKSLILAGLWEFVLFTPTLALPSISLVFIATSVLGGANDFVVDSGPPTQSLGPKPGQIPLPQRHRVTESPSERVPWGRKYPRFLAGAALRAGCVVYEIFSDVTASPTDRPKGYGQACHTSNPRPN